MERDFFDVLGSQVVVCDGAMGTMLHAGGVSLERCLPELNATLSEMVRSIHRAYVAAGVDIVQTNRPTPTTRIAPTHEASCL